MNAMDTVVINYNIYTIPPGHTETQIRSSLESLHPEITQAILTKTTKQDGGCRWLFTPVAIPNHMVRQFQDWNDFGLGERTAIIRLIGSYIRQYGPGEAADILETWEAK